NSHRTHAHATLVEPLMLSIQSTHGAVVDTVISGHTHFTYNLNIAGVPVIQSGANGKAYGRIDLVYDPALGGIDRSKTKSYAGVETFLDKCADAARDYCTVDSTTQAGMYEGAPFNNDDAIVQLITNERQASAPPCWPVL